MNRLSTQIDRRLYCLVVAVAILFVPSPAEADDQSVWQLLPYDVRILIGFEPCPPIAPRLQDELCVSLAEQIEATIGAGWNATVAPAPAPLRGALVRDIEGLQADQVPVPTPPPDKILLMAITCVPGGLEVTARDFDVRTRTLSSPVTRPVSQISELSDAALDALLTAFAPLARIVSSRRNEVVLRLKASGLPPRDPNLALFSQDDIFQPIHRYNDREGNLRRAAPVPWTFCTVEKILPLETHCRKHSGVRISLTKRGGRVESLALRVIPTGGSTMLTLKSRTKPHEPLSGYKVYSRVPGKKAAALLGWTDRRGQLLIPPEEHLLRVLLIKNGREPLARMPMVPGLEPEMTTEIANDDLRLWAEGFIFSLQEELVDIVARRKIYDALIRARIEADKLDQAEKMFEELRKLPTNEQFSLRVIQERDRLATDDHVVQKKINLFLDDTNKLIHQHLNPQAIGELERYLRDAKAAAINAPKSEEKKEEEKKAEEKDKS